MSSAAKPIRVTGTLEPDGRIRPDERVPLSPGPVRLSVTPINGRRKRASKVLHLEDLAGSAREAFKGVDVDKWLQNLRDEWDRKVD